MKVLTQTLPDLSYLNLGRTKNIFYQLATAQLVQAAIERGEGVLADSGALAADTGKFTGRSPKDRFIVEDDITRETVWWGDINIRFSADKFDQLYNKMTAYLGGEDIFVSDAGVCANEKFHVDVRVITETAYQNLFAQHLFIMPEAPVSGKVPEWTIIAAPGFKADPDIDGTRQENFSIINFTRKMILIGGTGYTGEIKKGMFSVLNFLLPHYKKVLPMHCSANIGPKGDTAIFFGLSGTGKTTLSADPDRNLIGDDEHGWSDFTIFNFEGGCYAKCSGLTAEHEPQIYNAVRFGALLENVNFHPGTCQVDFDDISKTENTRVAYPLHYIKGAVLPSIGTSPKNIFFLTADAFGVLPPLSRLTPEQAMYYFLSGYTAKIAGTEDGVKEPEATFSACFGKAFLPLHPVEYAKLLGEKIRQQKAAVWLVNTGWIGGPYSVGKRIPLKYTRAMVNAVLDNGLRDEAFNPHPVFGIAVPQHCPGVPANLLNPRKTWADGSEYDRRAAYLAQRFDRNFEQYEAVSGPGIRNAGPAVTISV